MSRGSTGGKVSEVPAQPRRIYIRPNLIKGGVKGLPPNKDFQQGPAIARGPGKGH
jgi:hypothetical protein